MIMDIIYFKCDRTDFYIKILKYINLLEFRLNADRLSEYLCIFEHWAPRLFAFNTVNTDLVIFQTLFFFHVQFSFNHKTK